MSRPLNLLPLALLVACSTAEQQPGEIYDGPAFGKVAGFVTNTAGEAVEGVTVNAQGLSAVSDANGMYIIDGVSPEDMIVVEFVKQGYAKGYTRTALISWETVSANKSLLEIDGYGTFDSRDGGVVEVMTGEGKPVTVEFDANSIVFDETGATFDGEVTVEITWVNPYDETVKAAPADLQAVTQTSGTTKDDLDVSQLVSYGMADVSLFSPDGDELNLEEGSTAGVTFPVTNGDLVDLYVVGGGDEIPSWSWNDRLGMWLQEGFGSIEADPDTGDLFFNFEAPHFSWWNCDQGYVPTYACGRVVDMLGFPVRGAEVVAIGGVTSSIAYTDRDGYYIITVMAGDTVNFTGNTFVADRNWQDSRSMFIDGGVSPSTCEGDEVPDIEIQVCRESGVVMTENITAHLTTVEEGNGDRMRAFFWEPPGDPNFCYNPWDYISQETCDTFQSGDYATHNLDDADALPTDLRSVGDWVQISTGREGYTLEKTTSNGKPYYTYKTEEFDPTSETYVQTNEIDFRGGDVLSAVAPGDVSAGMGPIEESNWVTMPHEVEITNFAGAQSQNAGSSKTVQFNARGDSEGILVLGARHDTHTNMICRFADDGSFTIPANAFGDMGTGSAAMSIFRPELSWTPGPDGLPIRIQAFAGAALEMDIY